jgi:hypothetical protein
MTILAKHGVTNMMKKFEEFISESETQDESKMSLRDVKVKFLRELIAAGKIKPTEHSANYSPEGLEEWLEKTVK